MIGTNDALVADGVSLRPMREDDLDAAHGLTAEMLWPHRETDWELVFRHGEGLVAERDGKVVATGLRWRWGERHATVGLIVVAPAVQGRRIGNRLMTALLDGLDECSVMLHATAAGRGLYERLGFRRECGHEQRLRQAVLVTAHCLRAATAPKPTVMVFTQALARTGCVGVVLATNEREEAFAIKIAGAIEASLHYRVINRVLTLRESIERVADGNNSTGLQIR